MRVAVTFDTRPATKRKTAKAQAMQQRKTVKRRDAFAAALKDARYRKRVVKSGKLYTRKAKPAPKDDAEA
jgi:hypothetical protein